MSNEPVRASRSNAGKTPMSLIPLDLLDGAARVLAKGAGNHGRNNYRKGFPPLEVVDSLMRHLADLQQALEREDKDGAQGYLYDADSEEADIHHIICNAMFLVDSMRKEGYRV